MKKTIKVILRILVTLLAIISVDTLLAKITKDTPRFHISENKEDGTSWVDKGFIIDTYYCVKEKDIITVHQYLKGTKFSCPKEENTVKKIVDKTIDIPTFACAQALEKFYEDENYEYYFSCIKGSYIVVIYSDNTEEPVSEALKKGTITIKDLEEYNIGYYKEKKE